MSVNNDENKVQLDGDGQQTVFEFDFKIFDEEDLEVYIIDSDGDTGDALTLNTDYTVTINKVGEGGSVTLETAPDEGEQVAIYRNIAITQPADIPVDTEYVEKTLENALDRSCMIDQQLQEQIDRSIKVPTFSDISTINFDTPQDGCATYWSVEDDTATLMNCETNPDDLVEECNSIKSDCEDAKTQCSALLSECTTVESNIEELVETALGTLPDKVPLTTWARLTDGNIYNLLFDDIKADTNRFIIFNEDDEDRRSLIIKANTFIQLETEEDTRLLTVWEDTVLDVESLLDDGDELTNGKDYSIFLVPDEDDGVEFVVSLNKTAPEGYDTYNTRRIGGFHTECADVGTVSDDNDMNGWLAGDIIPLSVWTLWHKPAVASPSGARYVPERDAWKTIYVQSGTGESTVFEYEGTTTRSRTVWDHELDLALVGWDFPTSLDFTISEQGIVPLKAVYGQAESSCTSAGGWVNISSVRMVTSGGDESTCGGLHNFLLERGPAGSTGWSSSGTSDYTDAYQYGTVYVLRAGGTWADSGYSGPSCRLGNSSALNTYAHTTARGWSRPYRPRG